MIMQKQYYFLSPVEVVKVTEADFEEIAEWCGGKVITMESTRTPGKMDTYVWVPTPTEKSLSSAYPGMYITKRAVLDKNNQLKFSFAVFRRDYFDKNYFDTPKAAVDKTWERHAKEEARKPKPPTPEQRLAEAIKVVQEIIPGAEIIDPTALQEEINRAVGEAVGADPEPAVVVSEGSIMTAEEHSQYEALLEQQKKMAQG